MDAPPARIRRDDLLASLPPEWPEDPLPAIAREVRARAQTVLVLDDDPTGTQTVHGVPILTAWPDEALRAELARGTPLCYLLTNSRSLPGGEAAILGSSLGRALAALAGTARERVAVISRGDSTLRGHFPAEVDALAAALGGVDATILAPAFIAGGRYTAGGVHYATEGEWLVPVGETEFARDATFGFRASHLRHWVAEKTGGRIAAQDVVPIPIETLRRGGPEAAAAALLAAPAGGVCVADAAADRDLAVLALGALLAEGQGRRFLYRTAASFVPARAGLAARPPLHPGDLPLPPGGGLIIVGSHVRATTDQLAPLLALAGLAAIEVSAEALASPHGAAAETARVAAAADAALGRGEDAAIVTSRRVLDPHAGESRLALGRRISAGLVEILRAIRTRPRYVLAKGGITASDLATGGLGVRRALVLGQLLPGVPVWELGWESRHPGLVYVVFPGNVGGPDALAAVVATLRAGAEG